MRIDCIRTYHLRDELDEPFGFSQWYYSTRNALLVEIVGDDGTTGWGECYGPAEVHQAAITSFYGPQLVGRDPAVRCLFAQAQKDRGRWPVNDLVVLDQASPARLARYR